MAINTTSGIRAPKRRPVEDIEAVLGKFSAWSTSQPASPRPRSPVSVVSYEQALHATSFRRAPPGPLAKLAIAAEGEPSVRAQELPPTRSRTKTARAEPATTAPKNQRRSTATVEKSGCHAYARGELQPVAYEPEPTGLLRVKPTFAEVVDKEIARAAEDLSVRARSVALTVRLAPDESALVKARAAEANISISAYLRQCALDVDLLREHVEQVLSESRAASAIPDPVPLALRAEERPHTSVNWRFQTQWDWLLRGIALIRSLRGRKHFEGVA